MSSTKHIILASASSFIIAITLVLAFVNTNESQFEDYVSLEIKFYEEKIPQNESNIFILGSSKIS